MSRALFHFLMLLLFFCSVAVYAFAGNFHLAPSEPLRSNAKVYEVRGRQGLLIRQQLQFGPYETELIRRGAITGWASQSGYVNEVWIRHSADRQSIRFVLSDGQQKAEAVATTRVHRNQLVIGNNPNSLPNVITDVLTLDAGGQENNFSVAIKMADAVTPWELYLDNTAAQLHRNDAAGYLRNGNTVYTLVPVWEVVRKDRIGSLPFGAAGLEFRDETGTAVAAVNLMNNGAIHISPQLTPSDQLLMATACSALLLQSVLD